jgi:hypothetical protein
MISITLESRMTIDETQRVLFLHWPGFMPQARADGGRYFVRLVTWPPSDTRARGELQAASNENFEAALRDLATFTPPIIRCRESGCVLCCPRD